MSRRCTGQVELRAAITGVMLESPNVSCHPAKERLGCCLRLVRIATVGAVMLAKEELELTHSG
jgi:hypothetical protein